MNRSNRQSLEHFFHCAEILIESPNKSHESDKIEEIIG
jgi:hypothetical protein